VGLAVVALLLTILVRAAYVALLLAGLKSRASRGERMKPWIAATQNGFDDPEAAEKASERFGNRRMPSVARMDRFRARLRRLVADTDYLLAQPLGWREGTIIVWAGMRGAITLAAAQTLPEDTPSRSLLILVAFLVATSSLLLQGGTLAPLISLVKPAGMDESVIHDERLRLMACWSRPLRWSRRNVASILHGYRARVWSG
jgi:NhaP-type Na+/H+ or K+/H+ antiporter